jgi:hypothetical protein
MLNSGMEHTAAILNMDLKSHNPVTSTSLSDRDVR